MGEKHKHRHTHHETEHVHPHVHDGYHPHSHEGEAGFHEHAHKHWAATHTHEHIHDEHHPHGYMHLPEIDKYAYLESPMHSWDPRLKLISIGGVIVSIVLISHIWLALMGLGFALLLIRISRIPILFVLEDLKWVLMFVSFFLVIMPLTVPGNEVVRFYFLSVSSEGINYAILITIKAVAAILLIFPMIGTMKFDITIKALERLKLPRKLVQMVMFTYRYIFLFTDEVRRMTIAIGSRGFTRGTNLYTLKTLSKMAGMLFVRSYERTERIYQAMVSRGYDGGFRTLTDFSICKNDVLKAFLLGAVAVTFLCLELIL